MKDLSYEPFDDDDFDDGGEDDFDGDEPFDDGEDDFDGDDEGWNGHYGGWDDGEDDEEDVEDNDEEDENDEDKEDEEDKDDGYGDDIGDGYGEDKDPDKEKEKDDKNKKDKDDKKEKEGEAKGLSKAIKTIKLQKAIKKRAKRFTSFMGLLEFGVRPVARCPKCGMKSIYKSHTLTDMGTFQLGGSIIGYPTNIYFCMNPNCEFGYTNKHPFCWMLQGKFVPSPPVPYPYALFRDIDK